MHCKMVQQNMDCPFDMWILKKMSRQGQRISRSLPVLWIKPSLVQLGAAEKQPGMIRTCDQPGVRLLNLVPTLLHEVTFQAVFLGDFGLGPDRPCARSGKKLRAKTALSLQRYSSLYGHPYLSCGCSWNF